jgi:nucleoside phosphorylase
LILDINLPFRDGDEPDRRGGINLLSELILSARFIRPTHVVALTGFDELRKEFEAKFNNGQWAIETYDPADIGWRERLKAKSVYIVESLAQAGRTFDLDLCVVTALNSPELDAVRTLPWDFGQPEALDQGTFLYRGQFSSEGRLSSVAVAAAPRMGMVATATLSQKIIRELRPRILAMTGICAGVRDACELGDVLVADPCWDWQMGKYVQEAMQIAPDQISLPLELSQRFAILAKDRKFFIEIAEAYQAEKPNRIPTLHLGPVASGSAVLADQPTVETIKAQHRKVLGVDMELYGMYSAVRDCSHPKPMAIGIKSVCDFADHLKNDKYQKYCSYMSAQTLRRFVEVYGCQILS